jgi:tetratricopeptide (TPR) repeat protein
MFIGLWSGEAVGAGNEDPLVAVQSFIPTLERLDAQNELATAWRLVMVMHCIAGRYQLANDAAEHSLRYARKAGNDRLVAKVSGILASTALVGRTPVLQAIAHCERQIADGLTDRLVESNVICILAQLRAMCGDIQAARAQYQASRTTLRDLERGVMAAASAVDLLRVELLGGDLELAEREVHADYEMLSRIGETYYRSTIAALLSCVVRNQGRDTEALAWSRIAEETMAPDEIDTQAYWRAIRAPIVARAGDPVLAEQLARTAVEMAKRTEAISLQAETLAELASVVRIAGRHAEARQIIEEAIALYEFKGNKVSAAAARRWAGEIES